MRKKTEWHQEAAEYMPSSPDPIECVSGFGSGPVDELGERIDLIDLIVMAAVGERQEFGAELV